MAGYAYARPSIGDYLGVGVRPALRLDANRAKTLADMVGTGTKHYGLAGTVADMVGTKHYGLAGTVGDIVGTKHYGLASTKAFGLDGSYAKTVADMVAIKPFGLDGSYAKTLADMVGTKHYGLASTKAFGLDGSYAKTVADMVAIKPFGLDGSYAKTIADMVAIKPFGLAGTVADMVGTSRYASQMQAAIETISAQMDASPFELREQEKALVSNWIEALKQRETRTALIEVLSAILAVAIYLEAKTAVSLLSALLSTAIVLNRRLG